MGKELLIAKDLKQYFPIGKDRFVRAVDGVNFSINEGEVMGLVGESGSGKSTIAYTVMGMYRQTDGEIIFNGQTITNKTKGRSKDFRRDAQIVFQDPGSSLNPYQDVRQILSLPLRVHNVVSKDGIDDKIREILQMVELPPDFMYKTPNSIGGGERQLVSIARALCSNPKFIILDEPTSSLDVSIQAQVLNLMKEIQKELNLTYLFIAHDLSVVQYMSDRIMVMYLGKIVEVADSKALYDEPLHPYTKALLSAIPVADIHHKKKRQVLEGEVPSPIHKPSGCAFHNRCPYCMDICKKEDPVLRYHGADGHMTACHLYDGSEVKA